MTGPPPGPAGRERGQVTRLLERWVEGDPDALGDLLPILYDELRKIAARQMRQERGEHTLQPTALVHEAYLRMVRQDPGQVASRTHFYALAAKAMRQILVDHARRRTAAKRGGDERPLLLDATGAPEPMTDEPGRFFETLALDQALDRLAAIHPRAARGVELRYFGGLTLAESAALIGISPATAGRDWEAARLWLHRELANPAAPA